MKHCTTEAPPPRPAGLAYFIVTASMAWYTAWQIVIFLSALGWGALICLCIWPPIGTLLPRCGERCSFGPVLNALWVRCT